MQDSYKHKGLRKKLVEELVSKGIRDEKVLKAIGELPRHFFFESSFWDFAYKDKAFPIGDNQTISQPYTVAVQSQLLDVSFGDKVLEVGTGSGYQAMILDCMGCKVFSVERQRNLFLQSKKILASMGSSVKVFYGDGYEGLASYMPFDKIIITCGAPVIPSKLVDQLRVGGVMVIPLGEDLQKMIKIVKLSDAKLDITEHGCFRFVPMLEEKS